MDEPQHDTEAPKKTAGRKNPLGSAAFYVVLATAAFLLWRAFAGGGGSGGC